MSKRTDIKRTSEGRFSLDVRGQVCPYPELLTLRALQNLSPGNILEVILDNPPSLRDISITLEKRGYGTPDVLSLDKGIWKIIVHISE